MLLAFVPVWWFWLASGVALGGVVALVGLCACVVGRQSEERRGGLLELDSWEARNALRHRDGLSVHRAHTRMVGRCGHLIGLGFDYVIRESDGSKWCSPACAQSGRSRVTPFAGGDAA